MRESLQRPLTKVGLLLGWHALFSKPRTRRFSAAGIGLNTITAVCLCGMTLAAWSAATNAPITGPWLQHLHPNSRCWQRPFCFKGLVRTAMQGSTWDLASMSTRMMQPADRGGRTWAASQTPGPESGLTCLDPAAGAFLQLSLLNSRCHKVLRKPGVTELRNQNQPAVLQLYMSSPPVHDVCHVKRVAFWSQLHDSVLLVNTGASCAAIQLHSST